MFSLLRMLLSGGRPTAVKTLAPVAAALPTPDDIEAMAPQDRPRSVLTRDTFNAWNGVCPNCGGLAFHEGPSGGMCVNITCATPDCGQRLNVAVMPGGPVHAHLLDSKLGPANTHHVIDGG
jgi:hypothetical protein